MKEKDSTTSAYSLLAGSKSSRRAFLGRAATLAVGATGLFRFGATAAEACDTTPLGGQMRRARAKNMRKSMADMAFARGVPTHSCNGDEELYASRIGNYSKALPHNALGEPNTTAYNQYLNCLRSGNFAGFENIPLAGTRKLTNPQCGLGYDLEGPDCGSMFLPGSPRFASAQRASEMAELYWMALLRDVPFTDWNSSTGIGQAANDLSHYSDFRGPKAGGQVTSGTIFRGQTPGDLTGPYVSQFMWMPIPYGALTIDQRMKTVEPGINYMADFNSWLNVQNGGSFGANTFDPTPRYIRNMRDLCQWVHVDALYQGYLDACLILLAMGAPLDPGNPYNNSSTQIGFGTFGGPHILSLVTEVATRALKAVWFQKWYVHRTLRPEEYGGRVHNMLSGSANYPLHNEILNSPAPQAVFNQTGSYLLPMAFPEGSPTHPSYGSGHATVAGACITILKAWFDESFVIPNPVEANSDGTALVPYTGPDLTVGGELNKVAANVASGRNMAGVHWRTDFEESVKLGEGVAIDILQEQKATYNEPSSLRLTKLNGTTITI